MSKITVGGWYRRIAAPRDHVRVLSADDHSVSYATRQGTASAPVARFLRMFTHDPKRSRKSGS